MTMAVAWCPLIVEPIKDLIPSSLPLPTCGQTLPGCQALSLGTKLVSASRYDLAKALCDILWVTDKNEQDPWNYG